MDKFSYAIGLGIGQNLLSMGARSIDVNDFAQAIKDVSEGNQTAISHNEAREIVNKYFTELEEKMNAENIEKGKAFLEENKKNPNATVRSSRGIEGRTQTLARQGLQRFSGAPAGHRAAVQRACAPAGRRCRRGRTAAPTEAQARR